MPAEITNADFKPLSPQGRGQGEGPPPGSTLVVDELPTGLTVRVPPLGYAHRNSFLLWVWSIFWCVITVLVAVTLGRRQGLFSATAFFVVFGSVGAIPLVTCIHLAKRQAAIAMVDDRLMIIQMGLLGSTRREWALDDIDTIEVGPSSWLVNKRPVPQLQIRSRHGETFGMLTGHDPAELHWLANKLTRQLDTAAEASPEGQTAP